MLLFFKSAKRPRQITVHVSASVRYDSKLAYGLSRGTIFAWRYEIDSNMSEDKGLLISLLNSIIHTYLSRCAGWANFACKNTSKG